MIICYINGNPAYPSTSSSIKVTFENAAIKDRESRTQELTFNLDIADNRKVFGAVNRIEVKKSATTFETCRLYADNLLVIEGTGTITSYSDTEVKLQIKTATAASQFPDSFSSLYIDRIVGNGGVAGDDVDSLEAWLDQSNGSMVLPDILMPTADAPLIPVYDETNARWLNEIVEWHEDGYYHADAGWTTNYKNYAPQPLLSAVVARIVGALGYRENGSASTLFTSDIAFFNQYPWSKLHIVNTNSSFRLRNMIPHWTAEKFFTELSHLFNISFNFNEKTGFVTVGQAATEDTGEEAHYECLDEFSSDYDEDGENLLASSNLAYNLGDSDSWDNEQISQDTVAQFDIVDYSAPIYLSSDFDNSMTDKEKLTRLFRVPRQMYYARHVTDSDGNKTDDIELVPIPLSNLVRQPDSSDTLDLNIVPVCLADQEYAIHYECKMNGASHKTKVIAANVFPTTKESKAIISEDYVTVEDVLEDTDSDKTEEQERMEIFFVDGTMSMVHETQYYEETRNYYFANCFTYYGSNPNISKPLSLALCDTATDYSIGKLHSQASSVDNHDTIVIKFEADDLPDPRKTYVFRNKRFLCDKIELEITADGISKIKTGYFFEMQ